MTNTPIIPTVGLSTLFEGVSIDFLDAFDSLLPAGDTKIISMATFQRILTDIERSDTLTGSNLYTASLESVHERLVDLDQSALLVDILE